MPELMRSGRGSSSRAATLLELADGLVGHALGPSVGDDGQPPEFGPSVGDDNVTLGPSVGDDAGSAVQPLGPSVGDDDVQSRGAVLGPSVGDDVDTLGPSVGDDTQT